ncbi:unnamed protein product, partial [Amoebophrya sp. A25]|eukprot:GSA25T00021386001.1
MIFDITLEGGATAQIVAHAEFDGRRFSNIMITPQFTIGNREVMSRVMGEIGEIRRGSALMDRRASDVTGVTRSTPRIVQRQSATGKMTSARLVRCNARSDFMNKIFEEISSRPLKMKKPQQADA